MGAAESRCRSSSSRRAASDRSAEGAEVNGGPVEGKGENEERRKGAKKRKRVSLVGQVKLDKTREQGEGGERGEGMGETKKKDGWLFRLTRE